jgi:hypothetical protein
MFPNNNGNLASKKMKNNNNQTLPLPMAEESQINSPIQAHIVSQTPGRIRIRVPPIHRQKQKLAPLVSALQEELAIYRVRYNIHSGGITIFHAQEHINSEEILNILQDLGVLLSDLLVKCPVSDNQNSHAAAEVSRVVVKLNQDVKKATQGVVDLRFLLPFSFAVLAVRQLIVKGLQFEIIPWYVLAWYSFDSFIKLHKIDEQP